MRFSGRSSLMAVVSVTLVTSCGGGSVDPEQAAKAAQADDAPTSVVKISLTEDDSAASRLIGSWTLVALDGGPVPEVGKTPRLEFFDDGSVAGVSGVNSFRTESEIVDDRISFGLMAMTKMAGPPEAMELESTFMTLLGSVSTFGIEGDTLRLWDGDNEALTFDRLEATP